MQPVIRTATALDLRAFTAARDKPSVRALCMELNGRVAAIGGIAHVQGRWIAFADLPADVRHYKMHIMRTAIRFLDKARRDGIRYIYARADEKERRSVEWLESLGFVPSAKFCGLYRWEA